MDVVDRVRRRTNGDDRVPPAWEDRVGLAGVSPASAPERFSLLMARDRPAADEMVRSLIEEAQSGCPVAPLTLVSMVAGGLRRLGRGVLSPDPVGEVVGEFVEVVYTLSVDRYRQSLAAALLLTTRRRLGRRREREQRWDRWMAEGPTRPWGEASWVGEELFDLLATIGLSPAETALILETRVFDVAVESVAERWGVRPTTVYKERRRAERGLQERLVAAAAA